MYNTIKRVIDNSQYELADMISKIETLWVESRITTEEKEELIALARANAKAENSYAPWQEQLNAVYKKIAELEAEIAQLKNGGETSEETTEEYPAYVQPTGSHDAYNVGDKITYNGKKYTCLMNGCVWNPDTYPQGWEEVVE